MRNQVKIAVAGGGASGLACAIGLKRGLPEAAVTVYEKLAEPGKKILATGNGRCNLSNRDIDVCRYSGDPALAQRVLDTFGAKEAMRFFDSLGLLTTEEDGRIYPLSMSAASVRSVLVNEANRLGVVFQTGVKVSAVEVSENGRTEAPAGISGRRFTVNKEYDADYVVLASGGKAAAQFGTDGDGYRILKSLGVRYSPISPALVQMTTAGKKASRLKGVRVRGDLVLRHENGAAAGRETGEILFTDYGLSGIAVMQLSGLAAVMCKTEKPAAEIDLCPALTTEEIRLFLEDRRHYSAERPLAELTVGMLHEKVGREVILDAGAEPGMTAGDASEETLNRMARAVKHFRFSVTGTKGFRDAQVTHGGVPASELREESLESRSVPGLFFCGELLDVDGLCGGYNLHFAWGSGLLAAKEITQDAQGQ